MTYTDGLTWRLRVLLNWFIALRARFLPGEPVGGYTEVQKAWQAWTFADFGKKSSGQDGRAHEGVVDTTDCAGMGFGAMQAGNFLPVEAAAGHKTVAGAYFRGRGACTQYDPKIILGATNPRP